MDQIANLVIDLGIDAAEFKNEIPRIKNLLNGAASDAERSSARMQRLWSVRLRPPGRQCRRLLRLQQPHPSMRRRWRRAHRAHERMAREVEQTRQRMEALKPENARGTGAGHGSGGGSG